MGKKVNLVGQKFNKLTVIEDLGEGYWSCKCDCGQIKRIRGYELTHNKIKSCGRCGERSNFIDITGQQIGEWEVLKYAGNRKWLCRCSCGVVKEVNGAELRNGKSKSCGHSTNGFKDLTGQRFGEWTPIEYVGNRQWKCQCRCGKIQIIDTSALTRGLTTKCKECTSKDKTIDLTGETFGDWYVLGPGDNKGYWRCQCSCGIIKEIEGYSLKSGKSLSCGHDNFIDLTGKHFGEWTVIKYAGNKMWLCRCSCGTIRELESGNLRLGNTLSCGCKQAEKRKETLLNRYGDTAASRLTSPRDPISREIFDNPDSLRDYMLDFKDKTGEYATSHELADKLGVTYHSINRKVSKLELQEFIQVGNNHRSSYEKELENFFNTYNIKVISNVRNIVPGIELDLYLPDYRIAIEINGDYWHSHLFKENTFHQNKTIECAKFGIRLIHIFEYEWLNSNKKDKLFEFLSYTLNIKPKNTLYARKLNIQDISINECGYFLNKYHLQGNSGGSVRLGLYDNQDLVGVMTFGRPRFNNEFEWEIIRLVYKSDTKVIGGTEKIFSEFIKRYNPTSVVCYSDISKFTGSIYKKLGFNTSVSNITKPNYIWTIPGSAKVFTRYQTQKAQLLKDGFGVYGDTEDEIMSNMGFVKIYDCGSLRFEWRKVS